MWATASWFLVLVVTLRGALAQTSDATCLPQFTNLTNSRGQSPCLVSAYVQGACNNGQWDVPSLGPNSHYVGPYKDEINLCQCSTVTYDLVSACALCQSRTIIAWSTWAANCTDDLKSIAKLPVPIPPGVTVPAWAYWDPQANGDRFSLAALSDAQGPESSAGQSSSIPTNPNTPIVPTPTSTPPSTPAPDLPNNSSNIGPIVGGVVGGVFCVGLLGLLVIWLVKRKRSAAPPSAQYNGYPNMASGPFPTHPGLLATPLPPGSIPAPWSPPPQSGYSHAPSAYGAPDGSHSDPSRSGSVRPYDPNDPSTHYSRSPSIPYIHPSSTPRPGHYTGVAEL